MRWIKPMIEVKLARIAEGSRVVGNFITSGLLIYLVAFVNWHRYCGPKVSKDLVIYKGHHEIMVQGGIYRRLPPYHSILSLLVKQNLINRTHILISYLLKLSDSVKAFTSWYRIFLIIALSINTPQTEIIKTFASFDLRF